MSYQAPSNPAVQTGLSSEPTANMVTPSFVARLVASMRGWLVRDGLALLLFAIMALATISPVVPEMGIRVIGWPGENIQYAYMTGWMAQALLLHQSPFVDPRLNYPDALVLTATDVPFVSNLAVAPITWLLGPTFGYNLIILISFLLSGYFTYLWVQKTTGSRAGGVIAGLAFLLAPYRVAHSYGHLQLVCTYALPLFFWALDHALRSPKPTWRALLLLAGATFLVGGSSQYYLVICLVIGAIYALLTILPRLSYLLRYSWRFLISVGAGAIISALPYFTALESDLYTPYNVLDTRIWSLDPINFVLPSHLHPLWGSFFEHLRPEPLWIEKTLYIGVVTGLLAILALLWRNSRHRRRNLVWLGVAFIAAIFALGTDLHLNNQPVQATDPVWLPAYYLAHVPFVSLMRSWPRFGIITILFAAMLAGVGAAHLAELLGRWRLPVLALCAALLFIDLIPGSPETTLLAPRAVDLWLARQPGDFAVAALPIGAENYRAMFGSLFHSKHMPAFNHPNHIPEAFRDFAQRAAAFPEASSIRALRQMGLRYLLLERKLFDGKRRPAWSVVNAKLLRSPDLEVVAEMDGVVVVAFR